MIIIHPQFILTGSANLLLMKRVSESLAGRAVYFSLMPMTRREILGLQSAGVWEEFFTLPLMLKIRNGGTPDG